jgi:hypothetical protein
MSERKTGNGTRGQDSSPASGGGRAERDHEGDKDEFEAGTGYQPSTNQARDEPLPASHHDGGRQDPARPGEPGRGHPSPGGQDHEEE